MRGGTRGQGAGQGWNAGGAARRHTAAALDRAHARNEQGGEGDDRAEDAGPDEGGAYAEGAAQWAGERERHR